MFNVTQMATRVNICSILEASIVLALYQFIHTLVITKLICGNQEQGPVDIYHGF